jgi:hypothetical protein
MFFLSSRLTSRAAFTGANGVTFFVGLLAGETHNVLASPALSALQACLQRIIGKRFPAVYDITLP